MQDAVDGAPCREHGMAVELLRRGVVRFISLFISKAGKPAAGPGTGKGEQA